MKANRNRDVPRIVPVFLAGAALALAIPGFCNAGKGACPIPPVAKKIPTVFHEQGKTRTDEYYWMRERDTQPVLDYLNAENDYTRSYMGRLEPFQDSLFQELKSRVKENDDTVPYRKNGYFYYERYVEGKEFAIYCRKRGSLDAEEEVMLNANDLAAGHSFFSIRSVSVSPDGKRVAFAVDTVGRRKYDLFVRDLETGERLGEPVREVTPSIAWANDNATIFYAKQHPETLRWYRIMRHTAGSDPEDDVLVYEEKDETFDVSVFRSRSDRYIMIASEQTLSTEYSYIDADKPLDPPVVFQPRERDHEYQVAHIGDTFYIRTNWNARNFRVMTASEGHTKKSEWREVVPARDDFFVEQVLPFRDHLVVAGRSDGLTRLEIRASDGGDSRTVAFDEQAYVVDTEDNYEVDTDLLRFAYSSMTTPETIYDYNMTTGERTFLKQDEIPGGYDPSEYVVERVMVPARDGEKIPFSLLYKKGLKKDGANPALIYGYGSYGYSIDPGFRTHRLTLVDRGFIYAIAHIRGGQELGRRWYEDGKLFHKKNTFTDFIDCAQYLVDKHYSSKELLFAEGGSAGGLLIGAVVNMRGDLFKGAVAEVPFVDVVTTMLDESIPLTTAEYDEWGNPNDSAYYEYMLSYSPYDNVAAHDYPALLVTSGYHDSQVQYWEPTKWVARLRAMKTDTNPLLLKVDMETGHGGLYGRFERYRDYAFQYAFILSLVGIEK